MTAYLGFENLAPGADISTTPEEPEYPAINAIDWFTYTWWKAPNGEGNSSFIMEFPSPITCDYFGIAAHNIVEVGVTIIRVQAFLDGVWENVSPDITTPGQNNPIFVVFPPIVSDLWRFTFITPLLEAPTIGVLSLGNVLALPEGIRAPFVPPPVAYDNKITNSLSQTGQFLGRSIERFGEKITINQNLVDPSWMRENWATLADAIETQPFFYCWNYEEYPEDTVYAWIDQQLSPPHYTDSLFVSFSIHCKSLHRIRWF